MSVITQIGASIILIATFLLIRWQVVTGRQKTRQKRIESNYKKIVDAARYGPFMCHNTRSVRTAFVRADAYCEARRKSEKQVLSGGHVSWKGLYLVLPVFTFKQSGLCKEERDCGTWEDAWVIKMEALQLASGLTKEEFLEVSSVHSIDRQISMMSKRDDRIIVPYLPAKMMSRAVRDKLFNKPGDINVAKAHLFEHIRTPYSNK